MLKYIRKKFTSKLTTFELIYWWVFRLIIISPVLFNLPSTHENIKLQVITNFCVSFLWEFLQFFPKNTFIYYITPKFQNFTMMQLFLTSTLGAYKDLYYKLWWWDDLTHVIGGALLVCVGYEIFTALQRKSKMTVPLSILILGSFSFSFVCGTFWELFEFLFDQYTNSDCQHWDISRAVATFSIFKFPDNRFPLIDTMTDMICNTVGAFVFAIILHIKPYFHMD